MIWFGKRESEAIERLKSALDAAHRRADALQQEIERLQYAIDARDAKIAQLNQQLTSLKAYAEEKAISEIADKLTLEDVYKILAARKEGQYYVSDDHIEAVNRVIRDAKMTQAVLDRAANKLDTIRIARRRSS